MAPEKLRSDFIVRGDPVAKLSLQLNFHFAEAA